MGAQPKEKASFGNLIFTGLGAGVGYLLMTKAIGIGGAVGGGLGALIGAVLGNLLHKFLFTVRE